MANIFKNFVENVRRHETFYDAFWLGQWLTELFGLSVLDYHSDTRKLSTKTLPIGLTVTCVGQIVLVYANISLNFAQNNSSSLIIRYGLRWFLVYQTLLLLLVSVMNIVHSKKTLHLVDSFHKFDVKLKVAGYDIDTKAQNNWFNWVILMNVVILSVVLAVTSFFIYRAYSGNIIAFLLGFVNISWTNAIITTLIGQFIVFNYSYQYRFKTLGYFLRELVPTEAEQANLFRQRDLSKNREIVMDRIIQIADLYSEMVENVEQFSNGYRVQLIESYVGPTTMGIFSSFTMYRARFSPDSDTVDIGITNFCWSLYYSAYQVFHIVLAALITSEAKNLGILVHKAINFVSDEGIRSKLMVLSSLIHQQVPKMSCKMFDFDGPLIFSTLGTITTYLVILIQFDILAQQN